MPEDARFTYFLATLLRSLAGTFVLAQVTNYTHSQGRQPTRMKE